MKLRKVKWNNHPILGNLELDFTDKDGHPYNTIVFAGENGCGKTTIMDTIATFLNLGSFEPFDCIEYEIDDNVYNAVIANNHNAQFPFEYDRIDVETQDRKLIQRNKTINFDEVQNDKKDIRHDGCVYSRARAHFPVKKVTSTTAQDVDINLYNNIDQEDDFTSVKQLLVDIQNQDEHILYEEHNINPEKCVSLQDVKPKFKMERFKSAFASFFDNEIQYSGIDSNPQSKEIEVYFKKGKDIIKIDDLSTGEKQIIYRGVYLLKNINRLSKGLVFIDEPEISMHPLWQKKIFKYYRDLFSEKQLFLATHSEEILKEVVKHEDTKIIIMKRNKMGEISLETSEDLSFVLPTIDSSEVNYNAFGIASTDYHNALYGYIEAEGWISDYKMEQGESENYIKQKKDGTPESPVKKCLSEKIRHIIHHPENKHNDYTLDELKKSIEDMRNFISKKTILST